VLFCCLAWGQTGAPEQLLVAVHRESRELPAHERFTVLWDLAVAATGVDPAQSAAWSLEMYELTRIAPRDVRWQEMNSVAARKNALTILCLTDPKNAAAHFLELDRSSTHQPNEDPRIDLSRHLFPRLWAKEGKRSLPAILKMVDFTSRTGQYPYIGIGHILPSLAKIDPGAAHSMASAAIERLRVERGIWRTPDDYVKFLRESWSALSAKERRLAVQTAMDVLHRGIEDKAAAAPGRSYAEYYLRKGTVRFDSEEVARVYDLLPYVDAVDAARGRRLRVQYPALARAPLPMVGVVPWRAGVFAAPGRDTPERVQAAFERYRLMFLRRWAREDAVRAAQIAEGTRDPARLRAAMALVIPELAKVDRAKAEGWRQELMPFESTGATLDDLNFLAALARAHFASGHPEDGERATGTMLRLGLQLIAQRDKNLPVYLVQGAGEMHDLADSYGEFRPDHLTEFGKRFEDQEPPPGVSTNSALRRGD
jgi:hypothetical protein